MGDNDGILSAVVAIAILCGKYVWAFGVINLAITPAKCCAWNFTEQNARLQRALAFLILRLTSLFVYIKCSYNMAT